MRLLYLYPRDLPSATAAPIQILHTAHALAELGVEVVTAWGQVNDPHRVLAGMGLGPHPGLRLVSFYNRWRRSSPGCSLRKLAAGADLVMSRGEGGVVAFAALRGERPFVYEAHRPVVARRRCLAALRGPAVIELESAAVREGAGLVGVSSGVLLELRARHGGHQPQLVLRSGTLPPPDLDLPGAPRDLDLLYVGKLERRKGLDVLLEAMIHLPGRELTLIGGSAAGLAALEPAIARARAAGARIRAVGPVEFAAVRGWLQQAKVGVCPLPVGLSAISERFTSPMKIMDMMACGTAIVASDLPSVREILTDGVNARLVLPSDARALAAAIGNLLEQPQPQLVERARADVAEYTWQRRAGRLLEFLQGLL